MTARVLVTGATGFVGSHTVAALLARGVPVRVLARTPAKVPDVLVSLGVDAHEVEVVAGDMADPSSVAHAVDGCRGVVHAAAQATFAPGARATMDTNVTGTCTVMQAAVDAGVASIAYTSSFAAYIPTGAQVLTRDATLGEPTTVYGRSKRDAEQGVRDLQAGGAPITTFVVGGVYGPTCPHLDGSFLAVKNALEAMMIVTPGGTTVIDVRDLAELLARAVVDTDASPRRFMAGGRWVTWQEWVDVMSEAVGREVPSAPMDSEDFLRMAIGLDAQRAAGAVIDLPLSEETATAMTQAIPLDDAPTIATFGVTYRPTVETFRDQARWMVDAGVLAADLVHRPGATD